MGVTNSAPAEGGSMHEFPGGGLVSERRAPHGTASRFLYEIEADAHIDVTLSFRAKFPARSVDELIVVLADGRSGPPVCILSNDAGSSTPIHMRPDLGREGHFSAMPGGDALWSEVTVRLVRGRAAKLRVVRLIGVPQNEPPHETRA
jgi:hypothetical protein